MVDSVKKDRQRKYYSRNVSPEAYDEYFKHYPSDILRSAYRAQKGIDLLGNFYGKALSVGVGNLGEASTIKNAGFDVNICDISPLAVEEAREKGFKAFICDISKTAPEGQYDVIFCLEVLEHVVDPSKAIDNLKKALKPRGHLVISLPNEFHVMRRLMILIGSPKFAGHDYHHLRFFDLKLARRLFQETNLKILGVKYAPLIPLGKKLLLPIGEVLKLMRPQLFALSFIWLLEPE